jgi:hypothetical protein
VKHHAWALLTGTGYWRGRNEPEESALYTLGAVVLYGSCMVFALILPLATHGGRRACRPMRRAYRPMRRFCEWYLRSFGPGFAPPFLGLPARPSKPQGPARLDSYASNAEFAVTITVHDWLGYICTGDRDTQPPVVVQAESPQVWLQ